MFKGTVSRDVWPFFLLKRFDLCPLWTDKNSFAKKFAKNVCLRSQRLRRHWTSVVNNYADSRTLVSVDNDFADIVSAKPFLSVHMGPRSNLLSNKKMVNYLLILKRGHGQGSPQSCRVVLLFIVLVDIYSYKVVVLN